MHPINCALDDNFVSDSNNITMTANTALFFLGGLVFLVATKNTNPPKKNNAVFAVIVILLESETKLSSRAQLIGCK